MTADAQPVARVAPDTVHGAALPRSHDAARVEAPYLLEALAPFRPALDDPGVIEILVDHAGAMRLERTGAAALETVVDARITEGRLQRLARLVAAASAQLVNANQPLLSASLPAHVSGAHSAGGARIQFVLPPASRRGVAMAIRKHVVLARTLDDYDRDDAFAGLGPAVRDHESDIDARLSRLARAGAGKAFLETALAARRTMIISGGTSSGKTTLLNALLAAIPRHERIVTIEDAPELAPPQESVVSLLASRGDQGTAAVTAQSLLEASLRLRPDRILLGELRGKEAFAFLRAVNTGHPGSLATVHADSPKGAYEQIAMMALQSGVALSRADILDYVRRVAPVVVQTARVDGHRRITALHVERT